MFQESAFFQLEFRLPKDLALVALTSLRMGIQCVDFAAVT